MAAKTSLDPLFVQYKCTVIDEIYGTICSTHKSLYRAFPLYKAPQIRRAAADEPTLLEERRFGEWVKL